jgi:hypothetical protein
MSAATAWVSRYAKTDEIHRLIVEFGPLVRDIWQVGEVFEFSGHDVLWVGPSANEPPPLQCGVDLRPDGTHHVAGDFLTVWRLAGGTGLGVIAMATLAGDLCYPPDAAAVLARAERNGAKG